MGAPEPREYASGAEGEYGDDDIDRDDDVDEADFDDEYDDVDPDDVDKEMDEDDGGGGSVLGSCRTSGCSSRWRSSRTSSRRFKIKPGCSRCSSDGSRRWSPGWGFSPFNWICDASFV